MTDEELLLEAKERFKISEEAGRENRRLFIEDLEFYAGDQWPENVRNGRDLEDRPVLTVNRIPGFVRQVTNEQRQNRPGIKVRPADDKADIKTAEIFTGLLRHVEANSKADLAYDNAFFYAVAGSFGFFRVVTEYCDDASFEQELLIKPIVNSLSVFYDHEVKSLDGSAWRYCFIVEDMPRKEFEKKYPGKEAGWLETTGDVQTWVTEETVRIAEYWYVTEEEKKILLLDDGTVVAEEEFNNLPAESQQSVADERMAKMRVVKWAKIGGHSVLEKSDWDGKYIPIIPVFGDAVFMNGKTQLFSLTRFAKDPQRMLNYYRSTETELLALQPKAPYVIAEGQIEDYEEMWARANQENFSALVYKPTTVAGVAVPAPQRQGFATPPTGVLQGAENAQRDMMSTVGIYESSLGQRSNETSGKAILARQREGDTSTYHFIDNMARAVEQCARILIDLAPKIYDTPRVLRILGEDGTEEMVQVNQKTKEKDKYGQEIERIYNLTVGRYDLVVAAGPSYTTRRQEASESMMQMVQTNPEIMGVAGDLIVKSMDWPGADQLAERLKKTLPPNLKEPEEGEEGPPMPPAVQAQMQQHEQLIQQLDQTVQQMTAELEKNDLERRKLEIDEFNAQTTRMKVEGDLELRAEQIIKELEPSTTEMDKAELDANVRMITLDKQIEAERELERLRINAAIYKDQLAQGLIALDENGDPIRGELVDELVAGIHELTYSLTSTKEILRDENGKAIGLRPVSDPENLPPEQPVGHISSLADVMQQLMAIRQTLSAPKEVIRDEAGRAIAVRSKITESINNADQTQVYNAGS